MDSPLPRWAAAAALLAGLALPATAGAAGFARPAVISGHDDVYARDTPAVVAPNGRTAVLYERRVRAEGRSELEWRLVTGPDPAHLGAPQALPFGLGDYDHDEAPEPELLARPDGALVLCLQVPTADGCSIAPPGAGFGPVIDTRAHGRRFEPVMRADGSLVLIYSDADVTPDGALLSDQLSTAILATDGTVGPEQAVARSLDEQSVNDSPPQAVALDDGTVAIAARQSITGTKDGVQLGVRIMLPGTDAFGPIVPVPGVPSTGSFFLQGGPRLAVTFDTGPDAHRFAEVVPRLPDGTFLSPLALPARTGRRPGHGAGIGSHALLAAPSGALSAVTWRYGVRSDSTSTCAGDGEIAFGPLSAPTARLHAERLSTPGQIATYPDAAVLDDGTVIAAWQNGASADGAARVEARVRAPGAARFGPSQPLPRFIRSDLTSPELLSAGSTAALLWPTQRGGGRHATLQLVVSAYATSGPYATAKLPRHPDAPCF